MLAIYSSIGLAGTLARVLREQDLLGVAFGAGLLIVIAAVVGIAVHTRPRAGEIWVAVGVVAVYGMVIVRMGVTSLERTHLFEYGLLAVLIYEALLERRRNEWRVPVPAVLAVLITALLGWADEGVQALLPNRVYDLRDVAINALAGVVATTARIALGWARRWGG